MPPKGSIRGQNALTDIAKLQNLGSGAGKKNEPSNRTMGNRAAIAWLWEESSLTAQRSVNDSPATIGAGGAPTWPRMGVAMSRWPEDGGRACGSGSPPPTERKRIHRFAVLRQAATRGFLLPSRKVKRAGCRPPPSFLCSEPGLFRYLRGSPLQWERTYSHLP